MSRMTKFLRQTCMIEPYQTDPSGNPAYNDFGELQYSTPVKHRCRRESTFKDLQTTNGQLIKATTRYYLDDSVVPRVGYLIDGRPIIDLAEYTGSTGSCEGYEVYV